MFGLRALTASTLMVAISVSAMFGQSSSTMGASTAPRLEKTRAEISFTYSALQTNASVGNCGCFWMRGGSAELALPVWRYVSGVIEVSGEHTNHVATAGTTGLSLLSGLGGLRVSRPMHTRFTPFGQGLVGGVHAFDSYFPGSTRSTTYATSLAAAAGLGFDVALSRHVLIRPIQAEYQYMQLPNASTNQQHDVRLSAGVVFRFYR
jgi:hypothetical protein